MIYRTIGNVSVGEMIGLEAIMGSAPAGDKLRLRVLGYLCMKSLFIYRRIGPKGHSAEPFDDGWTGYEEPYTLVH